VAKTLFNFCIPATSVLNDHEQLFSFFFLQGLSVSTFSMFKQKHSLILSYCGSCLLINENSILADQNQLLIFVSVLIVCTNNETLR